jgi:serine/threonine protein kinase
MFSNDQQYILNDYSIQEQIGSGSYGFVYRAIHQPSQLTVAMKMVSKLFLSTETKKNSFFEEINIFQFLHHPFIAEFYDFFESDEFYIIVMEYLPNGNLHDFIRKNNKLEENYAKRLFLQLISVLDYLHNQKYIVHRDLKSENIMLDKYYNIRVIDFGFSKTFQSDYFLNKIEFDLD